MDIKDLISDSNLERIKFPIKMNYGNFIHTDEFRIPKNGEYYQDDLLRISQQGELNNYRFMAWIVIPYHKSSFIGNYNVDEFRAPKKENIFKLLILENF